MGDRIGSAMKRPALRLAAVALLLIACVVVLSWPHIPGALHAAALAGLGGGLLAVARGL